MLMAAECLAADGARASLTAEILLIRHAAYSRLGHILSGRSAGVGLDDAGRRQAMQLAARLIGEPLAMIQSSPVQRARETAEAIAMVHAADVIIADDLDEIDFGSWTGQTFEDLDEDPAWGAWNTQRSIARPPAGESMVEVQERILRHLHKTAIDHAGSMVALVSHCDVIRAAVAGLLGMSLDNFHRFDIDPASITRVAVGDWGGKVLSLNASAA